MQCPLFCCIKSNCNMLITLLAMFCHRISPAAAAAAIMWLLELFRSHFRMNWFFQSSWGHHFSPCSLWSMDVMGTWSGGAESWYQFILTIKWNVWGLYRIFSFHSLQNSLGLFPKDGDLLCQFVQEALGSISSARSHCRCDIKLRVRTY
jgi:hypothetical protein